MQVLSCDIVYYSEFLCGFFVTHMEFFGSGVVAVQVFARRFEDVEKGNFGRTTHGAVRLYIARGFLVGQFNKFGF